jgi:hypothetical protein
MWRVGKRTPFYREQRARGTRRFHSKPGQRQFALADLRPLRRSVFASGRVRQVDVDQGRSNRLRMPLILSIVFEVLVFEPESDESVAVDAATVRFRGIDLDDQPLIRRPRLPHWILSARSTVGCGGVAEVTLSLRRDQHQAYPYQQSDYQRAPTSPAGPAAPTRSKAPRWTSTI